MAYQRTNWADYPNLSTAINAARLNNMEAGIAAAIQPGAGQIVDADVALNAAIQYVKLNLALSIVNGDISPAAAIAISKLAGYPGDPTQLLHGDGSWAAPAAVAPTAVTLISDTGDLAATAANVDLTSIPQTYTSLRLLMFLRQTGATAAYPSIACNGDATAANYDQFMSNGAPSGGSTLGAAISTVSIAWTAAPAGDFSVYDVLIGYYRRSGAKTMQNMASVYRFSGVGAGSVAIPGAGAWAGPAAITRITITPNAASLAVGSRVLLYGLS